jgi:Xaa-Pro aminopeptidase
VAFCFASFVLSLLRAIKDEAEVELLRRAAHASDRSIAGVVAGRLVGRTEADIAHEIRERLVNEGHDEAMFAIVASGPNSASPHHAPGQRVVQAGEPLLLDIGGHIEGYQSDTTRTFWVTGDAGQGPSDEYRNLYSVLQSAQQIQTDAVKAGLPAQDVDAVGRKVIADGGFGDKFIHRTGHSLGEEVHGNGVHMDDYETHDDRRLLPGTGFTIEPGIYTPEFGVRTEINMVVGPRSAEVTGPCQERLVKILTKA